MTEKGLVDDGRREGIPEAKELLRTNMRTNVQSAFYLRCQEKPPKTPLDLGKILHSQVDEVPAQFYATKGMFISYGCSELQSPTLALQCSY